MTGVDGVSNSILDAIGSTPIVKLDRYTRNMNGRILAKLEYLNPGFSKKDRVALQIIEDAEAKGQLSPGQTVVELTSGNTGTGLAIVCAVKGYPFVAVMSRGNSVERARMMAALGAEVVLVEQLPGSVSGEVSGGDLSLVEEVAREITSQRRGFRADQFRLQSSSRAHFFNTAQEILRQTGGQFDAFCDFIGTAGSFAGCAAAFKEKIPSIRCYVIEPHSAAPLSGKVVLNPSHRIQGGGYSMNALPLFKPADADGFVTVTDRDAIEACRRLAQLEGIFVGYSSGANVAAACGLIENEMEGKTVVVILNDSGLKYLSTDLWRQ